MAKLTGIEVAKFLAKQSKADRNYIERAAKDFKKRGGKRAKRRKSAKKAQATTSAPARKSTSKKKSGGNTGAYRTGPGQPAPAVE